MIKDLIMMNGYGFYVWFSFGITILACGFLYYKTFKKLKKYEKELACKILELSDAEREIELKKSKVANQVFLNYNK
ncbi:MAG: heme exporter protein CcmD [Candidatus Pelagibacter sp.]|nr:heme exporter protein CcmD [Candidatus Pelagibacter sp.]OUW24343.1 MAG: heme exporter protein CcmD [Rickettsiales bacterium TMED174]|tara:strand:- start:221 stop:448 length:228 start_codon:yes stop_codon:yes gene_type:complete